MLADRLREQIVSGLHRGEVRAGDRLPSIRQVSAETGRNARAVARAYRVLEAEGLVEVRERSGVYAAPQPRVGMLLGETAQWAARVLVEASQRGIAVPAVPEFFRRCAALRSVRCAFVESSRDVIAAFTHDLREDLGLDTHPVWVDSLPPLGSEAGVPADSIPPALAGADLVVTTAFHAAEVGPWAEAAGKPLVAATVNPEMVTAVQRQLRSGGLTAICVDARFGDRLAVQYQDCITAESPLRVIDAADASAIAALDVNKPVLLTRAAHDRLGDVTFPLVFPHSPTLSSRSTLEIAEFLVRFNLEGGAARRGKDGG